MSTSSNHNAFSALEAQPSPHFQTAPMNDEAGKNLDEQYPEVAELRRAFKESRDRANKSFEKTLALCKMCLEKMDKILAIVAAMRQDREERERRQKASAKEQSRIQKNTLRKTSRRVRRTR